MQEQLRKEVVRVDQQTTPHQIMEFDKEGPTQRGSPLSYQKFKGGTSDSVLEVHVLSLGVKSASSTNPIFSVFLVRRADLRRVEDDALLYRTHITFTSPSLPLDEWTSNNAMAFRDALDKGY